MPRGILIKNDAGATQFDSTAFQLSCGRIPDNLIERYEYGAYAIAAAAGSMICIRPTSADVVAFYGLGVYGQGDGRFRIIGGDAVFYSTGIVAPTPAAYVNQNTGYQVRDEQNNVIASSMYKPLRIVGELSVFGGTFEGTPGHQYAVAFPGWFGFYNWDATSYIPNPNPNPQPGEPGYDPDWPPEVYVDPPWYYRSRQTMGVRLDGAPHRLAIDYSIYEDMGEPKQPQPGDYGVSAGIGLVIDVTGYDP